MGVVMWSRGFYGCLGNDPVGIKAELKPKVVTQLKLISEVFRDSNLALTERFNKSLELHTEFQYRLNFSFVKP